MGFWTTTEMGNFYSVRYVRMPEVALNFQDRTMAMFNNPNSGENFQTFKRLTPWSSTQQKLTLLWFPLNSPPPQTPPKCLIVLLDCLPPGSSVFTSPGFSDIRGTLVLPSCFRTILPKVGERKFAQKYSYWLRNFIFASVRA